MTMVITRVNYTTGRQCLTPALMWLSSEINWYCRSRPFTMWAAFKWLPFITLTLSQQTQ